VHRFRLSFAPTFSDERSPQNPQEGSSVGQKLGYEPTISFAANGRKFRNSLKCVSDAWTMQYLTFPFIDYVICMVNDTMFHFKCQDPGTPIKDGEMKSLDIIAAVRRVKSKYMWGNARKI
jgi:hypothetical protein